MREIEFRAWDPESNTIYLWEDIDAIVQMNTGGVGVKLDRLNIPVMDHFFVDQYTGLKDVNGAKIFEGDICSFTVDVESEDKVLIGAWRFDVADNGRSYFYLDHGDAYWMEGDSKWDDGSLQIIGNIHQNPELLG